LLKDIEDCNKKLERASKLITGLEGEKIRWTQEVFNYGESFKKLPGNCLLAAGMVGYSGPFTAKYRTELETQWYKDIQNNNIVISENMTMMGLLEDKVAVQVWKACQLPTDSLSIQNAIVMFKSKRWPLMIDPQTQANKFIKNLAKDPNNGPDAGIHVMKTSDANLLRNLELAIQTGKWVLIENVGESLDPSLEPILINQ
jgi:dynein heavy chain, axonemal